jgi:hypothetical protein
LFSLDFFQDFKKAALLRLENSRALIFLKSVSQNMSDGKYSMPKVYSISYNAGRFFGTAKGFGNEFLNDLHLHTGDANVIHKIGTVPEFKLHTWVDESGLQEGDHAFVNVWVYSIILAPLVEQENFLIDDIVEGLKFRSTNKDAAFSTIYMATNPNWRSIVGDVTSTLNTHFTHHNVVIQNSAPDEWDKKVAAYESSAGASGHASTFNLP